MSEADPLYGTVHRSQPVSIPYARSQPRLGWPILLLIFVAALALRLAIVASGTVTDGDWNVYATVAHNLLHGCGVSMSEAPPCIPHFGGNGLPGYPAFIAAIWSVAGETKQSVLWAQAIVGALVVPRLAAALCRLFGRLPALVCGLVVALSPLQAYMARSGLAEALTIAAATLLLAELVLSLAQRRLRVVGIALVTTIGLFLRLDFVAFLVPVAVVGLVIHRVPIAALRGTVLAVLLCIPLGLWSARNLAVGVDVLPPARGWMLVDGTIGPLGLLAWLKQWVTTPEQRAGAMFIFGDRWSKMKLADSPRRLPSQDAQVDALVAQLAPFEGKPFPPAVDQQFATLATEAAQARSLPGTIGLRLAQAWGFWRPWAQPLPPEALPPGASQADGITKAWLTSAFGSGLRNAANTLTRFYRLALGLAFIATLVSLLRGSRAHRTIVAATWSLVLGKTLIGVVGLFLEARYTLTAVPWMETTVALTASSLFRSLRRPRSLT